jgi:hypothetical protein
LRTQPEIIIAKLEADNSRLAKEAVLAEAMTEGLDEFFEGVRWCLDKLHTFGVKQVPESTVDGQGLSWLTSVSWQMLCIAEHSQGMLHVMLSNWLWMCLLKINGTGSIAGSLSKIFAVVFQKRQ